MKNVFVLVWLSAVAVSAWSNSLVQRQRQTRVQSILETNRRSVTRRIASFSVRTALQAKKKKSDRNLDTADSSSNNNKHSSENNELEEETSMERTSFDQAGRSLMDEEDRQRMEQMGDFDLNPSYQTDSIEKMRAAIRERTKNMGLEKSKVSADYIAARQQAAQGAGSAAAADQMARGESTFAGLDLSKISGSKDRKDTWNEDLPTMFYEPEDEMTLEEQEEVDPLLKAGWIEQFRSELSNAKWPSAAAAAREVVIILVVIAVTAFLLIGWDKILREIYTSVGFIPTMEDVQNYAKRFDGLDLPSGWANNMNEQDVQSFSETINAAGVAGSNSLPDLQ